MLIILLWIGILGGILSSTAALYGRYYTLPSFLTGPNICKLEAGGCQVLFRSRNAAILGVPNSFLGILFYALLIIGFSSSWPIWFLLLGACAALVMSIWLASSLIANKRECMICWFGHFSNAIIWIVLAAQL